MKKVLFISPHPDDETLGCGGTIIKHKDAGDKIYWLLMTNIFSSEGYRKTKVDKRNCEIDKVAEEYDFDQVFKLDFPTTKLDTFPKRKIVQAVSEVMDNVNPEVIYIPYVNDVHSDHKITFDSAISSIKTFRYNFIKRVLMYEVVSETEFSPALQANAFAPNCFSDISDYLEKKLSIMKIYKGEIGKHPFPRSAENIKALAIFRGATVGVKYAEAFMILKEIW